MVHVVRNLSIRDVPRILEIQSAAYRPDLLETAEVFASKIESAPGWCLGVDGDEGRLVAYVIAFPMSLTASVGLHETGTRATSGDTPILYVHDMAVDPMAHGTGVGSAVLGALENGARKNGQSVIELVAIESAVTFWETKGFEVVDADVYEGYGPGARKMRRLV